MEFKRLVAVTANRLTEPEDANQDAYQHKSANLICKVLQDHFTAIYMTDLCSNKQFNDLLWICFIKFFFLNNLLVMELYLLSYSETIETDF